ncbi:cyclin-domain-containing protein [Parasitella parasitica]|nr:cyclin-domain-containing protein [Parasitella parasitica]
MTASFPILSITNPSQLADFCAVIIPSIWAGSFKRALLSPKRHTAFKIYVQKVLKATQISCTCMVLALHYIQRLRTAYPSIRASIGSEVRLFTTALVLANKFLDDNTFTNKTWSEVSSIPINELNIMEMEFLSALDYNIHIPDTQFFAWTSTCQQWWTNSTLMMPMSPATPPPPPAVVPMMQPMKRTHDYIDEYATQATKKRYMDDQAPALTPIYNYNYPTPPINVCKPILSWSSSVSALTSAANLSTYYNNAANMNTFHHHQHPYHSYQ